MNIIFVVLCFTPCFGTQEVVLKLCCKRNEFLDAGNHTCIPGKGKIELPLITENDEVVSVVEEYETCESNSFLVVEEQLSNEHGMFTYYAPKHTRHACYAFTGDEWYLAQCKRKINAQICCPTGQMLDMKTDTCKPSKDSEIRVNVLANDIEFGYAEESLNLTVRKTPCGGKELHYLVETYSDPKTFLIDYHSEHLVIPIEHDAALKAWRQDEYCIATNDENKTIIRLCYSDLCQDKVCIKKCCEPSYVYSLDECRCVRSDDVRPVDVTVRTVDGLVVNVNTHEVYSQLPVCSSYFPQGLTVELNNTDENQDTFWILENGSLHYSRANQSTQRYCVETGTISKESKMLIAVYCHTEDGDTMAAEMLPSSKDYLYFGLMTFSCFFLLLIIIVHLLLPDLRNLHGISIMCQAACLFFSFMGLALVRIKVTPKAEQSCLAFGLIIHYCLIASFTWLSTMAVDFFWMFSGIVSLHGHLKSHDNRKLVLYSVFGWGLPMTLTASAASDNVLRNLLLETRCWFDSGKYTWYYVHGPIAALLIVNVFLFMFTAFRLYVASRGTSNLTPGDRKRARQRMIAIMKLFVLMGLNWFTEVILVALGTTTHQVIHIIFDVINMLVPFLIFVLVILTRRVLDLFGLTYYVIGDFLHKYGWEPKTRSCHGSRKSRRANISRRAQASRGSQTRKMSSTSDEGRRFNESLMDRTVVTETGL